MHINEVYEHTPILTRGVDAVLRQESGLCQESTLCQDTVACAKSAVQCVDVMEPVVLTPTASVGTPTVCCMGAPSVTCVTNAEGTACTVTTTQRVCVTLPVTYGVNHTAGDPTIVCAETPDVGGNCCCCG